MNWKQIINNDELNIWPTEKAEAHGVYFPNAIASLKHDPKVGVLAAFIFDEEQAPLGEAGLDYLTKEKQAGRIESGFVLILRKHERKLEFVNAIPFEEMKNRLRGHEPHGDWSELPPKFFGPTPNFFAPKKNGGAKPVEISIQAPVPRSTSSIPPRSLSL